VKRPGLGPVCAMKVAKERAAEKEEKEENVDDATDR
jgi:hypothetical protein